MQLSIADRWTYTNHSANVIDLSALGLHVETLKAARVNTPKMTKGWQMGRGCPPGALPMRTDWRVWRSFLSSHSKVRAETRPKINAFLWILAATTVPISLQAILQRVCILATESASCACLSRLANWSFNSLNTACVVQLHCSPCVMTSWRPDFHLTMNLRYQTLQQAQLATRSISGQFVWLWRG